MAHAAVTIMTAACDGCGSESKDQNALGQWANVQVSVRGLDGSTRRGEAVDLCPACLAKCYVPGLERRA